MNLIFNIRPLVRRTSFFLFDVSWNQVTRSLNDLPLLFALMRVVRSLLQNPHIHIEPYVSYLMLIYIQSYGN